MGKLKFYCDVCKKDLDKCQCPDLEERFKERFAGSCLEKEVMAAVEAVREKVAPKVRTKCGMGRRRNAA
jgi:hypothetical protein